MDRDTYIRNVYSKYWLKAYDRKYGFSSYDRSFIQFLLGQINGLRTQDNCRLLEVAIGTGYPVADILQRTGLDVHGVDISPRLVERCRHLNSDIHAVTGSAESLQYTSNCFDIVYCFQSTWFFTNLSRAISEMMRVARPGGLVVFDAQNRNNGQVEKAYRKQFREVSGLGRIWRQVKNVVKVATRHGFPQWRLVVHQVPSYPAEIGSYLKESGCEFDMRMYIKLPNDLIREVKHGESLSDFDRLIYVVKKGELNA